MSNLNLELLKIFYAVAKEESITKASESLFISQPAVSQSIKKLEEEIGGTLFNRSNKGISLTEEGKNFYNYVKNALEMIEKGEDEFLNFKSLQKGKIKIGISTMLTKHILLTPLLAFHRDYPKIQIEIVNGLNSFLFDELEKGKLDLCIYSDQRTSVQDLIIKKCHHCFIYNKDFFTFDREVEIKELENYPLILQNKKSNTREMFDFLARKFDLKTENITEVVSQELIKTLTLCGLGIGFFISEFIDEPDLKSLKIIKLKENLPPFYIKIAKSSFQQPNFATQKFIDYILKSYQN